MNCDKEYEYRVEGLLLTKVDQDTGEEVLDNKGEIKLFIHYSDEISNEYGGIIFEDKDIKELR